MQVTLPDGYLPVDEPPRNPGRFTLANVSGVSVAKPSKPSRELSVLVADAIEAAIEAVQLRDALAGTY